MYLGPFTPSSSHAFHCFSSIRSTIIIRMPYSNKSNACRRSLLLKNISSIPTTPQHQHSPRSQPQNLVRMQTQQLAGHMVPRGRREGYGGKRGCAVIKNHKSALVDDVSMSRDKKNHASTNIWIVIHTSSPQFPISSPSTKNALLGRH